MDKDHSVSQLLHETEGRQKIRDLQAKIDVTQYNIEASEEIISHTPSDAQREKLRGKNDQRRHAVGSMKKEIRDIEQTMEERGRERA